MKNTKLLRGIKIRLLPTKKQEADMIRTSNVCRAVWNWALALNIEREKQHLYTFDGHELCSEFRKAVNSGKLEWTKNVAKFAIYQTLLDLHQSYQYYKNNNHKHPKFKSKKRYKHTFADRCDKTYFAEKDGKMYVVISKIGWIRIQTNHILSIGRNTCTINNPRIFFVGGKWIFSCALEREKQAPKLNNYSIGIDLGLEKLAVVSYDFVKSIVFKNINKGQEIRALEKRLKRYQRKLCECYEKNALPIPDMVGLTDYQKTVIRKLLKEIKYRETRQVKILKHRIQKLYRKLSNKRKDYIHKITRQLVEMLPKRIVLENLKISNMVKNRHLSKSIYDALWYFFRQCIVYKAEEYGIEVVIANTWYPSSKTCSFCGNINKNLQLKERTYVCSCCHSKINRDLNAAKNLENYGM